MSNDKLHPICTPKAVLPELKKTFITNLPFADDDDTLAEKEEF